ncbi:hypothetical protein Tco_0976187 [Tanacetum coccineum]|uniref:Uncharacterized protein n=1 Tax=Tanacetum coccineum TaxID=301880 RepID=A0ABQ5EGM3_9ASTR
MVNKHLDTIPETNHLDEEIIPTEVNLIQKSPPEELKCGKFLIESFSPSPIPVKGDDTSYLPSEFESFQVDYPDLEISTIDKQIYIPGNALKSSESTRFLTTLSPVIDTLLPFSSENEDKVFNHGVLASEEKSPPSSSYRGLKAFQLISEGPMMIHRENTPNLGLPGL